MTPGDRAFGGVRVPGLPPPVPERSKSDDTPPSHKIKDMVRQYQHERTECRLECKAEIERFGLRSEEAARKASSADKLAAQSATKADSIDAKFRIIIGMLLGLSTIVLGVVGWLAVEVRNGDQRARETAEIVAEKTVLASDRRIDERLKQQTVDAIREYRRQEQAEVDRLVAKAPK